MTVDEPYPVEDKPITRGRLMAAARRGDHRAAAILAEWDSAPSPHDDPSAQSTPTRPRGVSAGRRMYRDSRKRSTPP